MIPPGPPRPWLERLFGPWVREVDRGTLKADALAGLLGAVLALPQAIAFAALAGLPPAWGLYTAIVPCAVAALAGSSRVVLSGPTNAVSLALAAMLAPLALRGSEEYLRLALVVTFGVGLIQLAMGLLRLGIVAHFVSPSVMLGFTSGAALLIAWHAAEGVVGDLPALAFALATLAAAALGRRLWARGPYLLAVLALAALAAWALTRWPGGGWRLDGIGALPQALPVFQLPPLAWGDLGRAAGLSLALTVVALGQTMAIAKTLAAREGQGFDANRECVGQGLSNLAGSCFSCFVSSGSLNRSVPNVEAGARTPLAGVFAALAVLALALVAGPALAWVPVAAIAGLLGFVAWQLVDLPQWRRLARLDRTEAGIALATFVATLALPLQQAILGGVGLSLVAYLLRTARPAMRSMGFDRDDRRRPMVVVDGQPDAECPQLKMLRMEGSVYFGAAPHVAERLRALREGAAAPKHLLVMTKSMNFVDHAGAALWEEEHVRRLAMGGDLYFHRPRPEVLETWQRRGFLDRLGPHHVFDDKRSAIATIVPRLDPAVCAQCRVRLFEECARQPGPPDGPHAGGCDEARGLVRGA